ncbi:hypothetical protein NMG60_11025348 [Bertholletia excelsa]
MGEEAEKVETETESEAYGGGGPEMDTPDRSRIAAPVSKIEDSPVFNYINSLSPIKPVKSVRISQTFNSFNFASLPPIFTSPHASSLKESRFSRRQYLSDSSKPEFSSENGQKACISEGILDVAHNSDEQQENFDPESFIGEASVEPTHECSKFSTEASQTLNYNCGNPELAGTSGQIVPYGQDVSQMDCVGSNLHLEKRDIEQNKEEAGCDWGNMVSDASDLFVFDSPNVSEAFKNSFQKQMDPGIRLCTSLVSEFTIDESSDMQKTQAVGPVRIEHHDLENLSFQVGEGHLKEIEGTGDVLADTSLNKDVAKEQSEQIDNEPISGLHRGMRRRCLLFEMGGPRRKHLDASSSSGSSMLSQANVNIESKDKQPLPVKRATDSSRCIVPGIGLHLNALARTSKEYNIVNGETLASVRQLTNDRSPNSPFHSLPNGQESLSKALVVVPMESNGPSGIEGQGVEDAIQASGCIAGDDFNQGSPKKKRRRVENVEEGCKRCNCKKSKCLKLYCECFAAGVYCVEPCSCQDCFNKPIHEETVLATRKQIESRNPLAFAPKVIRSTDSLTETGDESSKTPASARHKRGCNCKKSGCLKKYCECYQGGVGCSINCRCEGCKNAFGRKDVSASMGVEAEPEEEDIETCEKSVVDKTLEKNLIQSGAEPSPDATLLATPLKSIRASVQPPFPSKGKPPRSSFLSIGSSSGLFVSRLRNPSLLPSPPPELDKGSQIVREDEMPEILQGTGSPISGVKSASPNSKRVSPPHCSFGSSSSPGRRNTRKLILQSIPSFPSLTPKR